MLDAEPKTRRPLLARLTTPVGPARLRRISRHGAEVVCLPGRYSVTHLLLGPEAVGIVDVGSSSDIPIIVHALRWLGRPHRQVRWVLPTHLHFDHVLGVDALAGELGASVALGEATARQVSRDVPPRWPRGLHLIRAIPTWIYQGMPLLPADDLRAAVEFGTPWGHNRFRAPVQVLGAGELEGFPGWRLIATPGHADDAICLHHAAARILVAGDTVRNFCGGEWNPLFCSGEDYQRTRERLLALEVETIFPAHGPVLEGAGVMHRLRTLPWWSP